MIALPFFWEMRYIACKFKLLQGLSSIHYIIFNMLFARSPDYDFLGPETGKQLSVYRIALKATCFVEF